MKKTILAISGLSLLMGCAQPSSTVLPAYKLADGRVYQDVVSIGADGSGTAPTVTMVNTYALGARMVKGTSTVLRRDKCGRTYRVRVGAPAVDPRPVATATASQSGVWNIAVAGASAGVAGAALTNALRHDSTGTGTTIYNTNTQTQTQDQSQSQLQSMP